MRLSYPRAGLLALAGLAIILLAAESLRRCVDVSSGSSPSSLFDLLPGPPGHQYKFLSSASSAQHSLSKDDGRICPTCDCLQTGSYLLSPWNQQIPTLDYLNSPQATKCDFARYLSHNLFVQSQIDPVPVPAASRLDLYNKFSSCPDTLFSFSFKRLKLHLPTAYAFTRTSRHGRLGAPEKRIRYLTRHAETIKEYYKLVETEGYLDGVPANDRQLLWLIIEDDDHINPEIARWLINSEIRESFL